MNGWDQRILGAPVQKINQPEPFGLRFSNPAQMTACFMRAIQNPAQFVLDSIPGLPREIANDPNRILQYLKERFGVSDNVIGQLARQVPHF